MFTMEVGCRVFNNHVTNFNDPMRYFPSTYQALGLACQLEKLQLCHQKSDMKR